MLHKARWDEYYQKFNEYRDEHGTSNVPFNYVTEDGCELGTWVKYQRAKFNHKLLTESEQELLDKSSMIWNLRDAKWDNCYNKLLEYYKVHGNIDIIPSYVTDDGYKLGSWLMTIKQAYKGKNKRQLDAEKIAMLNDLFIDWANRDTKILNSEIVKGCCFDKYRRVMLNRMKHILEDLSYEADGKITSIEKQKVLEKEIILRMWR